MSPPLTILLGPSDGRAAGLVAVDKPAGLASTGRTLDDPDCVQHRLAAQLGRPVWAVHQLDRDTSGVNLFVVRKALVAPWQARLRRAVKRYVAICHGEPDFEERVVEAPIGGSRRGGQWVWAADPAGRPARSTVRVRRRGHGFALVEVDIATGRTHQVRIHLAHLGHPLVGERRYRQPPCTLHPRHALHAERVGFSPADGALEIRSPLPDDLAALVQRLLGE